MHIFYILCSYLLSISSITKFAVMKSILSIIFSLFFLCSLTIKSQGQYNWDIGIRLGSTNYLGEIGGKDKTRRNFILDMRIPNTGFVVGGFARYKINNYWSVNAQINYGQIRGDDAISTNPGRMWRNLRFKNNILELTTRGEFNFFEEPDLGGRGRYKNEFKSFIHAGLTCFYHNPKGSIDGNTWHLLQPLQTEGQKYSKIGLGIPLGLGGVFTFDRNHRIGIDFSWTSTFTDYLDDISTVYQDPSQMSSLAASLANQSEGVVPIEESLNFVAGEKRGDPTHDDAYIFMTVSYSYFIQSRNKYYKNSRAKLRRGRGRRLKGRKIRAKF